MWPFLLQIWFDKNDHEASSGTGIKRFTDPKYMILKSSPYVNCCFRTSSWKISRIRWMKNMPSWLPTCFPSWPPKVTYIPNGTRYSYVETSWLKLKHARWTAGRTEASQNWSLPHVGFGNARNIELRMKGLFKVIKSQLRISRKKPWILCTGWLLKNNTQHVANHDSNSATSSRECKFQPVIQTTGRCSDAC